jgi:hypothetical protein
MLVASLITAINPLSADGYGPMSAERGVVAERIKRRLGDNSPVTQPPPREAPRG